MKKKLFIIPLLFASLLTGCVKYNGRPPVDNDVDTDITEITCTPASLVFNKGDEKKSATATVVGNGEYNEEITLKSNDKNIATVSTEKTTSGTAFYVVPVAVGNTTIKLTSVGNKNITYDLKVEVNDKEATIPVEEVKLNKETLELVVDGFETLTANVLPETATDKTVVWASSDDEVATVDQTGKVTAMKVGTAYITCTSNEGHKVGLCQVTVKEDEALIPNTYYLVGSMTEWKPKASYKMTVNPSNANEYMITWLGSIGDEVKVVKTKGDVTQVDWFDISNPTDMGSTVEASGSNAKLLANATYTLYFDTSYNHYWFESGF